MKLAIPLENILDLVTLTPGYFGRKLLMNTNRISIKSSPTSVLFFSYLPCSDPLPPAAISSTSLDPKSVLADCEMSCWLLLPPWLCSEFWQKFSRLLSCLLHHPTLSCLLPPAWFVMVLLCLAASQLRNVWCFPSHLSWVQPGHPSRPFAALLRLSSPLLPLAGPWLFSASPGALLIPSFSSCRTSCPEPGASFLLFPCFSVWTHV